MTALAAFSKLFFYLAYTEGLQKRAESVICVTGKNGRAVVG
jgi:hypothetical protein